MTVRVLVVDDEAVARRRIRRHLAHHPRAVVAGECADGASAVSAITTLRPDIVFLDVQMPELDGFQVVQALPASAIPTVIFVTAFDRYAVRAFDVHAIDYLLKPFTRERFDVALGRAMARFEHRTRDEGLAALIEQLRARPRPPARVAVHRGNRVVLIDWSDVDWVEAADNYVKLHVGRNEYLLRHTLAALEQLLDSTAFARVHRSAIVRIDRIAELVPESHGDFTLRLRDGTELTLSRTFRHRIERVLGAL